MCRNPFDRLGSKNGVSDIKNHKWFENINWNDVYKR